MIVDYLKNCALYESSDPQFKKVFDFLKKHAEKPFPDGKNIIDGEDVYANVFSYDTVSEADGKYENHREYIDIHYITEGEENIYWAYREVYAGEGYDPEGDVSFHDNLHGTPLPMKKGMFAVFYPNDIHMPKCMLGTASANVKKVVAKIKI